NVVFVGVRWGFKARQIFRITLGHGSEGVLDRLVKEIQDYTGEPIQTIRVSSDYQEVARALGVEPRPVRDGNHLRERSGWAEPRKNGTGPPAAGKTPPRRATAPQ
ncbi:MAG: hypothetical protein HY558_07760, partial [Euryarchaeota archaeon]|nr:hypothetical protein [Euryarchaeota archaeon]